MELVESNYLLGSCLSQLRTSIVFTSTPGIFTAIALFTTGSSTDIRLLVSLSRP